MTRLAFVLSAFLMLLGVIGIAFVCLYAVDLFGALYLGWEV